MAIHEAISEMKKDFEVLIKQHQEAVKESFSSSQMEVMEKIGREILRALMAGNKILLCGNGGSASDSQHIATEFIVRFSRDRKSLPALALTTDTSALTAIANDYSFEQVFSRQIEGLGVKGDLLIAISTSGNSKNVLSAVHQAKKQEILTVGLTGSNGGELKKIVDICFQAGSSKTSHIQEIHITALHAISEVVENVLFGS